MTIQFCKIKRSTGEEISATGACGSKDELLAEFKKFIESNGTRVDDFDEFHCRIFDKER